MRRRDPRLLFQNIESEIAFLQLALPIAFIVAIYLPLSLYFLVQFLLDRDEPPPYSWSRIHGPGYTTIYKTAHPYAPWFSWMEILLASSPILSLLASPRNTLEGCVELIFDCLPIGLQVNLPSLRLISARCKERRQVSQVERKLFLPAIMG